MLGLRDINSPPPCQRYLSRISNIAGRALWVSIIADQEY